MGRRVAAAIAVMAFAPLAFGQGTIVTVAGSRWVFPVSANGGKAVDAPLLNVTDVAVDVAGNLFAADSGNNVVVKISPAGILTIVAGNGSAGFSGDGGPATDAALSSPTGVAVDAAGNLYIADDVNNRVRKVTPDGTIATVAGNGSHSFFGTNGDGGPATAAYLNGPSSVAVDESGNLYIAEAGHIRKVDSNGAIWTLAGRGPTGFSGDGGPAVNASLSGSLGIAVDLHGNLYIADRGNHRVRKVDTSGIISTVAGNGGTGSSGDGGPAGAAQLGSPSRVAVDSNGNIYIVDSQRLRKLSSDGTINTVAGTGQAGFSGDGGPAVRGQLENPQGVALDRFGDVYIADTSRVRRIDTAGVITTIAGSGTVRFYGDGGPATSAQLGWPDGIAVGGDGSIFIADSTNDLIRKIDIDGIIHTIAGTGEPGFSGDGGPAVNARFRYPRGIALDASGALYVADVFNHRIRKIAADGTIRTVAGNGEPGFSGDGDAATGAQFYYPQGVAVNRQTGDLYIADSSNYRIRKVTLDGTITTVAGNGEVGFSGDGGPAREARLAAPSAIALDNAGNLYFTDSTVCYPVGCAGGTSVVEISNQRIRKVDTNGTITTVAGNGQMDFAGDGGPATSASVCFPEGLTVDSTGNVYIVDSGNNAIRKVEPGGTITTLAFTDTDTSMPTLNLNVDDYLKAGGAVAADAAGDLYVADFLNHRVRKVVFASPSFLISSVVNAASFRTGNTAPGSIVSIFGRNLASGLQAAAGGQLPTVLLDTAVSINGTAAPLFSVSPGQINAQIPFETPAGTVAMEVRRRAAGNARASIGVAAVSPGIFVLGGEQGAIVTSTGEVAARAGTLDGIVTRPASRGEVVSIFLTGLGDVANRPPSGAPTPGPPAFSETLLKPTVTIGGVPGTVTFSGLAPFQVGVYQVNARVAEDTPSGSVAVTLTIGGVASNTVTIAVE